MMKYVVRTFLWAGAICLLLFLWMWAADPHVGLGIPGPLEPMAEYHLRMMYFHGREKDGRDLVHGERLVRLGERAAPTLAEACRWTLTMERYQPMPYEMLAEFPEAAHRELSRLIDSLPDPPANATEDEWNRVVHQRLNLSTALIICTNDWSYLDLWLTDADRKAKYPGFGGEAINAMFPILKVLEEEESAPRVGTGDPWESKFRVDPKFIAWWNTNRSRIVSRAAGEGPYHARGWYSWWFHEHMKEKRGPKT